MAMQLPDIEVLELASRAAKTGIPDFVKQQYDAALTKAAKGLWRGIVKAAASGFGKGVLVTAGLILAGWAMASGFVNIAGGLPLDAGISNGLGGAIGFLTGGFGLVTLGIGGTLGAVSEARKTQGHITAEIARFQAQYYALERQLQPAQEKQPVAVDATKPWNQEASAFTAREQERRAETAVRGLGA